jgi:hypothetical protein
VQDVLDGLKTNGLELDPTWVADARREVASTMIFVEVAKRYAKAHDYPEPTLDPQTIAAQFRPPLPANDKFVQLLAESRGYTQLLQEQITPVAVTEDDYLAAADHAIAQGVGSAAQRSTIAEQIKGQFGPDMGRGIAVRDELAKAVKQYDVSVNPLFAPASTAVLSAPTSSGATVNLVELPLTNGAGEPAAVIDVTRNG